MEVPRDETLVIVSYDVPELRGYMNLYDPGDIWIKVQGCEKCESSRICCGKCPHRMDKGCQWHFESRRSAKPFVCVVDPDPRHACSYCELIFECIMGPKKGKRRHVKDKRDILR